MVFSLHVFLFIVLIAFTLGAFIFGQSIGAIVLFLILWLLLVLGIHKFVITPLNELRSALEEIGRGDFGVELKSPATNEVKALLESFNEMTKRLQDLKERDASVSRLKSEFLSITAHQLRTPLSALKWVLRMTLDGDVGTLKKAQIELLEKGYLSNERMITLVNDLLDVVRIEEGRFAYVFKKSSITEVLESVVKEQKIVAEKRGVELSFHKPSHALPDISLDAQKLRLAVSNIIDNAVRYTKKEGRVDVELTFHDDEVIVLIKDTGIGIPMKSQKRLFSKFFRAANALKMQTDGSGLGLFIARNIIEKHGGKIWIESEEKKGTSVYFTIPVSHIATRANMEAFLDAV